MRANEGNRRMQSWRRRIGVVSATVLALSMFGATAQAANSRDYSVTVSTPTLVSQGAVTKFDIIVDSDDNQTIANVHLSVPAIGQTWPAGATITTVFGANASMCAPSNGTSLSCDFGNIAAFGIRQISILATVGMSVPVGTSLVFSASAETNNENGSNVQVEPGFSAPGQVNAFNANTLWTANLGGDESTLALGSGNAGNLQTTLNLLGNNGGNGNTIAIVEGTNATQPGYCVTLKLTCQPDFTDVTVNAGAAVSPYLETILTAKVPKTYNIRKAFVIHVQSDGVTVEPGFPLFNSAATSCLAHPTLVPCADFSLSNNILTVTVRTFGNGKFNF